MSMFAPDLGELAYGSGDVVLSNEVDPVAPGDAAVLPISCDPEAYFTNLLAKEHRTFLYQNRIEHPNYLS